MLILDPATFQKTLNRNACLHIICIFHVLTFLQFYVGVLYIYLNFFLLRMHLFIVGHEFYSFLVNFFMIINVVYCYVSLRPGALVIVTLCCFKECLLLTNLMLALNTEFPCRITKLSKPFQSYFF